MIPERWRQRVTGPALEPVTETAPVTPVPLSYPATNELTSQQMQDLALALHERWHGDHIPERGVLECARLSGAFDDAEAIAPLITEWLRTTGRPS